MERKMDRKTFRQTGIQMNRHAGGQIYRWTDIQMDRHTDGQTEMDRQRWIDGNTNE
jgi:hypothetical protein